jgi:1,4-dihydroxy-2-naphthoate polyprenyltransferase
MTEAACSPAADAAAARPVGWGLWLTAARPRTLPLSAAPVLAALALAGREAGVFHVGPAAAALLGAMLIQIGTNYYNDAADGERGADGPDRLGPRRATASGWTAARTMKRAAFLSFGAASVLGLYLAWVGGWPILLLGALSLVAGWAYTGGPRPIAYTALGELFVFLFFGLAAVCGTYWLQTGGVSPACVVLAAVLGAPAAAVLTVNNHRDRIGDTRAGRRTLAILLGPARTTAVYAGLLLTAFGFLPFLAGFSGRHGTLAGLAALPFALALIQRFRSEPPGPGLNGLLAQTAQFQVLLAVLICAGLLF